MMNARQLVVLAGLAAVSVVATAAVMRTTAATVPSDRRGDPVVPALRSQANELTGLTIRDGTNTIAIERGDNGFVVADSGFPVKLDAVRDLVASSAELTFEEARTADPARYGDLGLADSGTEKAGKEIVFRSGKGDIADIVVGNRDATVGSAGGGEFVRVKGQPQTWLARGNVQLPANQSAWYVPLDFDVKRSEIKKIELTGGGRDAVTAVADAGKPGEFTLENVPEKRSPDTFKVSQLATPIDAFTFQDVRRRTGPPAADARHMVAETGDGVRVTLTSVGPLTDGWVQVTAEPTGDSKPDKASAIAAKTEKFEFRLPSQQAEVLGWTVSDVTNEKPADAEPKPGDPGLKPADGLAPGGVDLKPDDGAPKAGDGDTKQ
jgi:Domain of unknown function (DUF4340)